MTRLVLARCAAALLALAGGAQAGDVHAQQSGQLPTVELTARVRAREVFFHEKPVVIKAFRGTANTNVWRSDRTNLPDEVEPNVIYRDVGILLTITSTLPNIEELVDAALASIRQPQPTTGGNQPRQETPPPRGLSEVPPSR